MVCDRWIVSVADVEVVEVAAVGEVAGEGLVLGPGAADLGGSERVVWVEVGEELDDSLGVGVVRSDCLAVLVGRVDGADVDGSGVEVV